MGEDQHGIAGICLMGGEDGIAIAFLAVDEAVLTRAAIAQHPMEADHRTFVNRAKAGGRTGARKHLHGGKGAVTGPEGKDQLVRSDGIGANFSRRLDLPLL